MSDTEPPDGDGQSQQTQHRNGGSLARLRNLLRLLRRPASRGPEAAMEALIAAADLDGDTPITPQERFLIGNILKVHERNAGDVMVPRVDIVALDVDQPFSEVVKCMVEHGHSRVPVYRETLDDVIGFIHVKDVLAPVADRRPAKLERLLRKVLFVAPSLPILDLLVQMRQARTHIAMVVDEFGGIDGLVTIEDLIEEIVGEIEDEHDVAGDADPDRAARRQHHRRRAHPDRGGRGAARDQPAAGGRGGDGRYAGRAGLHAGRAGAEARRGHRAPGRHRIRGARCRSAARQAAALRGLPAGGREQGVGQCLTARCCGPSPAHGSKPRCAGWRRNSPR